MKLQDILKEAEAILDLCNGLGYWEQWEEAKSLFASIGMDFLGNGISAHTFAAECEEFGKVVVKVNFYGLCHVVSDKELEKYPLLKRRYVRPVLESKRVLIQPRVECPLAKDCNDDPALVRAAQILRKWLRKLHGNTFDCHAGNVGYLKGKLMIFDVMV